MTIIGDNVFIGINSIILSGSNIGNNVIIGAGSVVSGRIPDNEVWGGNPAKFICSLDEYYKKCQKDFENGAVLTVKQYKDRLNRFPTTNEMHFFSTLFLPNNSATYQEYLKMSFNWDEKEEVLEDLGKNENKYESFNDFLKSNNLI